jgi:hypothetical protein
MTPVQVAANPFALMTNPEAVFAAMARSDRLQRLTSRMCRPLDKVMLPKSDDGEVLATEESIEAPIETFDEEFHVARCAE